MHKLLRASKLVRHGLKDLVKWWLGRERQSYKDLFSRPAVLLPEVCKPKRTWRKIEGRRVPTICGSGELGRFSHSARELIPLNTLATNYPQRLNTLYEYATLDAIDTLRLYELLRQELEQVKCVF